MMVMKIIKCNFSRVYYKSMFIVGKDFGIEYMNLEVM